MRGGVRREDCAVSFQLDADGPRSRHGAAREGNRNGTRMRRREPDGRGRRRNGTHKRTTRLAWSSVMGAVPPSASSACVHVGSTTCSSDDVACKDGAS
jgi:hypothetical protein